MQILIEISGWLLLGLALLHCIFPSYFKWKETLAALPLVSRQIHCVHTFFIALTVALMGLLCITSADLLVETALGRRICLGLAVFWSARLLIQFFGYSPTLWKGRPLETIAHVLFSVLWIFLSAVFWTATIVGGPQ